MPNKPYGFCGCKAPWKKYLITCWAQRREVSTNSVSGSFTLKASDLCYLSRATEMIKCLLLYLLLYNVVCLVWCCIKTICFFFFKLSTLSDGLAFSRLWVPLAKNASGRGVLVCHCGSWFLSLGKKEFLRALLWKNCCVPWVRGSLCNQSTW